MPTPLIELAAVTRSFPIGGGLAGRRRILQAVRGVSLRLAKGEVLAVVGESGCGKSTLARILLGLLAPTTGDVMFDGRPMERMSRIERAAFVQPVFQDPMASLNPLKRIEDIIALPMRLTRPASRHERHEAVVRMMELVGLSPTLATRRAAELSGGQRQRVAIARALIASPQVLVCDEPTSALDVSIQAQILNLFQDLGDRLGLSYLLISHNLAVVEHLADTIAVMYLGRIVEFGRAADVLDRPRHPYTRTLLDSILKPGADVILPTNALDVAPPDPVDPPSGCAFHPRCPLATDLCAREAPGETKLATGYVACHHAGPLTPVAPSVTPYDARSPSCPSPMN